MKMQASLFPHDVFHEEVIESGHVEVKESLLVALPVLVDRPDVQELVGLHANLQREGRFFVGGDSTIAQFSMAVGQPIV